MSQSAIPKAMRARVAAQAHHRCGYCLTAEAITGISLEIDHLIPEALGGLTQDENLWLACGPCNSRKSDRVVARDPFTDAVVPLFNPRYQVWSEHFAWAPAGDQVVGLTPVGRATVSALELNRPILMSARQGWVRVGWHPPRE
jgi:hypothetical protein